MPTNSNVQLSSFSLQALSVTNPQIVLANVSVPQLVLPSTSVMQYAGYLNVTSTTSNLIVDATFTAFVVYLRNLSGQSSSKINVLMKFATGITQPVFELSPGSLFLYFNTGPNAQADNGITQLSVASIAGTTSVLEYLIAA